MNSLIALVLSACAGLVPQAPLPNVAIVVDDIGYRYDHGRAAIELPHSFAYAVLPFSPHAKTLAELAHTLNKDVIAHVPMEAEEHNHLLGPGALRLHMSRAEFERTFFESISAVPHAIGINNHMGSRLTREPLHMNWLMQSIGQHGKLFFVDSRTTSATVALRSARENDIESVERDVFLDNLHTRSGIEQQLRALVQQAKEKGFALGIAHPHPTTIETLANWQPSKDGVKIVRISDYLHEQDSPVEDLAVTNEILLTAGIPECGDEGNNADAAQDPYTER